MNETNPNQSKQDPMKPPQPMASNKSKTPLWVGLGLIALLVLGVGYFAFSRNAETEMDDIDIEESLIDSDEATEAMEDDMEMMDDTIPSSNDTTTPLNPATGTSEEADSSVKTFEITGKNFEFSQKEIRVNQGDTVRIVFSSTQGFHDWMIDEFEAATEQVNPGTTTEVEFVADQAGTFEYYCSVGSHRQLGMVGNLIVE